MLKRSTLSKFRIYIHTNSFLKRLWFIVIESFVLKKNPPNSCACLPQQRRRFGVDRNMEPRSPYFTLGMNRHNHHQFTWGTSSRLNTRHFLKWKVKHNLAILFCFMNEKPKPSVPVVITTPGYVPLACSYLYSQPTLTLLMWIQKTNMGNRTTRGIQLFNYQYNLDTGNSNLRPQCQNVHFMKLYF